MFNKNLTEISKDGKIVDLSFKITSKIYILFIPDSSCSGPLTKYSLQESVVKGSNSYQKVGGSQQYRILNLEATVTLRP